MKTIKILLVTFVLLSASSCVQKTYTRKVNLTVDVSQIKNIKTVGIRGEKPLDWDYDTPMIMVKKDSLYKATVIFETGYKFVDVKFTVNGDYELKDKPNRKVTFSNTGETNYNAIFEVAK